MCQGDRQEKAVEESLDGGFTKRTLDYFLRTLPPREGEAARGADVLAAEDRKAPDERTAVERGADERTDE